MTLSAAAFVVLTLALAVMLLALVGAKAESRRRLLAMAAVLPAVLITVCVVDAAGQNRWGQILLSVERVRAAGGSSCPLGIGGEIGTDHLLVDGAPRAIARVCDEDGHARVRAAAISGAGRPFVVAAGSGRQATFPTSLALTANSEVCLGQCDNPANWFVFEKTGGAWRFRQRATNQEGEPLRLRRLRLLSVSAWSAYEPSQGVQPLSRHLPVHGEACQGLACVSDAEGGHAAYSLVFQDGGFRGRAWRILLLDPEARLRTPEGTVVSARERAIEWPADGEISVWEPRYFASASNGRPFGRMQERRAFDLAVDDGLVVRLVTPSTRLLGVCPNERKTGIPNQFRLPSVGGELGGLTIPADFAGARCHAFQSVVAQAQAGALAVDYRLTRMGAPVWVCVLVFFWSAILAYVFAGTAKASLVPILVLGLQYLLALRLLIALAGSALDPAVGVDAQPSGEALIAYVAAPALLVILGLWRRLSVGVVATVGASVFAVTAAVSCWLAAQAQGTPGLDWPIGLSLAMAVAAVVSAGAIIMMKPTAAVLHQPWAKRIWAPLVEPLTTGGRQGRLQAVAAVGILFVLCGAVLLWAGWIAAVGVGLAVVLATLGVAAWRRGGLTTLAYAGALRFFFLVISVKERLPVAKLAVSALYTPLLLRGFGGFLAYARGRSAFWPIFRCGVIYCLLWGALFVGFPWWANDTGYIMVGLAVAGAVAWGAVGTWPRVLKDRSYFERLAALLPWAAPIPATLLVLAMTASLTLRPVAPATPEAIAAAAEAPSDQAALDILSSAIEGTHNDVRLWNWFNPEAVAVMGSWEAENMAVWSQSLAVYTDTWTGGGFMRPMDLGALRPVQMTDNLVAIHIIAPFGRLGAGALLLLLAALAVSAARATRTPDTPQSDLRITGLLALWTLFGVGLYMVLANLQLAPFSGRNVYLLAAASDSDLFEGVSLFILAWWGLRSGEAET